MKHPQHILAFCKQAFGIEPLTGFILMTPKVFFESAARSLFIGRRAELEKDERFGQFLPYVVLWRKTDKGPEVFAYQRTKKVGEQRLAGNLSIGVGGHIDFHDVCSKDSVIDVILTTAVATARELNEEVVFEQTDVPVEQHLTNRPLSFDEVRAPRSHWFPRFAGLINDTSDEVGRVHYGAVFALEVPDGLLPQCKEEELTTIGFVPVAEALARGEGGMENWSKLVLENFEFISQPQQ